MEPVTLEQLTSGLPPPAVAEPSRASGKVVVLDDDPTGTQTVHGIPVLTRWRKADLEAELRAPGPGFYVLTNSRALTTNSAVRLAHELGSALREASQVAKVPFTIVSRSDSTLRGHFPAETDALVAALCGGFAGTILIPALFAAGRITVGDIHYARVGNAYLPAGETEFARDSTFGYRSSNLRDYVEEKTGGAIPRDAVVSISIEDIRTRGSAAVARKLAGMRMGGAAIVNALEASDLQTFVLALSDKELAGRQFMFRTAADFVAAAMGIKPKPLLSRDELVAPGCFTGGLLVAGSYVGQTSRQLEALARAQPELDRIELNVPRILDDSTRDTEIAECRSRIERTLETGKSTVIYTSRVLVRAPADGANLEIGSKVSNALVSVVSGIRVRPSWLIAKGGITSSDVATRALGIVRATVLGQALPGVPVWKCGPECKWPGMSYVVFPGNVGGEDALARLVCLFDSAPGESRANP